MTAFKIKIRNPRICLPCVLTRKQIFILPTRYGVLFIVVLLAMLMGSANYNNNMGFLLTFLLGSMTFISILHTYKNLAGFEILSITPEPVFAGEFARFQVVFQAAYRPGVKMYLDKGPKHPVLMEADRVEISCLTEKRGVFIPGFFYIATNYPLGLFRAWSRLNIDLKCVVYPRPIYSPFEPKAHKHGDEHADGSSGKRGAEDFQGLKAYQPGDSLHHISWKAFSKGQGLLIKEFSAGAGASVVLNWDDLGEKKDTEQKLSLLCALIMKAETQNIKYGLNLPGRFIAPDKGEVHKHQCLKALALFGLSDEPV